MVTWRVFGVFAALLPQLASREGTVFMLELPWHFQEEAPQCAREAQRLIRLISSAG